MANNLERNEEMHVNASGSAVLETPYIDAVTKKGYLDVKQHKWIMPEWLKGWIALIPALIFLIVFMIYPIINSFMISFINNFYWVGGSNSSLALRLSDFTFTFHFHALEKEMAPHSSVLAWRIPGTGSLVG